MKYLVKIEAPADRGDEIHARGGPGPIVAALMQRFRPEHLWATPLARTLYLIVELPDAVKLGVLMEFCADRMFAYPEVTPIVPGSELERFAELVHVELGEAHGPAR